MAAHDNTVFTKEMEDAVESGVLLPITDYMKNLSDRLDAFMTANQPSKQPHYPSLVSTRKRSRT